MSPFGFRAIKSRHALLSKYSIDVQRIPSDAYSSYKKTSSKSCGNVLGCLFETKYVLIEIELKLFVGVIDAELLETVHGKYLEAENVQETNKTTLESKFQ